MIQPLAGIRVCSLAINLPGPLAAARLVALGATMVKIEPPGGDPLAAASPAWYAELHSRIDVRTLDLKAPAAREQLYAVLAAADLLITASRPAALARLGLAWPALQARYPALSQVAIVGHAGSQADQPGHDLTYQAAADLLDPPHLPRALLADSAGAERAVSTALALLLARGRSGAGGYAEVALAAVAWDFAAPLRHGLTRPGGLLGGGLPSYGLYRAADGWLALAALEQAFQQQLSRTLDLPALTQEALAAVFRTRPAAEWAAWAADHGLPLVVLPGMPPEA